MTNFDLLYDLYYRMFSELVENIWKVQTTFFPTAKNKRDFLLSRRHTTYIRCSPSSGEHLTGLSYDKFWCTICSPLPNVLLTVENIWKVLTTFFPTAKNKRHVLRWQTTYIRCSPSSGEHLIGFKLWQMLMYHMFSTTECSLNSGEHMKGSNYILSNSEEQKTCSPLTNNIY